MANNGGASPVSVPILFWRGIDGLPGRVRPYLKNTHSLYQARTFYGRRGVKKGKDPPPVPLGAFPATLSSSAPLTLWRAWYAGTGGDRRVGPAHPPGWPWNCIKSCASDFIFRITAANHKFRQRPNITDRRIYTSSSCAKNIFRLPNCYAGDVIKITVSGGNMFNRYFVIDHRSQVQ